MVEYLFENFVLDPKRFELREAGVPLPLEPQVFRLLDLLVRNRDRMVSKDEIVAEIWQGRIVSDASISSRVRSARAAIGDDGSTQAMIRTVHGQGFRFIAEVCEQGEPARIAAAAAPGALIEPDAVAPALPAKPSIVVLPFRDFGTLTSAGILADAIPHELIQALSRLRWLSVIARGTAFRFRTPDPDIVAIGAALHVHYVLEGTIEARGEHLEITVELSDSGTGEVVWADCFVASPDAIHALRADIVARVVSSLEVYIPLNEARIARLGVSENLDAWSNYHLGLQHMYRFTRTDNARATAYFETAVAQDPRFARAHAGLSFTSFQSAFMKYDAGSGQAALAARRFAERSIELDPLDPFANFTMGRSFWLQGDPDRSIQWLDRAILLSPNYAHGHYSHAFSDMIACRAASALRSVETAFTLSPLDPFVYGMFGTRSLAYMMLGDYANAAIWGEKAARAPGAHFLISMIAVIGHALEGNRERAHYWAADVKARRPDASQRHFFASFAFRDPLILSRVAGALAPYGF
jgi:TolB-like protein